MTRIFFTVVSIISAILAALTFAVVYKQLIDIPEEYEIAVIGAIPLFALISVISLFIQSGIRQKNEKQYRADNPAEGSIIRQEMIAENSYAMESALFQLQVLRGKISGIVGRVIAAILLGTLLGNGSLLTFLLMYIIVSYCWLFIKATGNYIIGIVAFILVMYGVIDGVLEKFGDKQELVAAGLLVGVFVIDIINIIRFFALRVKITNAGMKIRRLSREEMKVYYKKK